MTVVQQLSAALADLKSQGFDEVSIESLESFIDAAPIDQEAPRPEAVRALVDLQIERTKAAMAHDSQASIQEFLAEQNTAEFAVKSSILVNGGASVALLAFLGNLAGRGEGSTGYTLATLNWSMIAFVAGVGVAGFTAGLRFLSQACYTASWNKTGMAFKIAAVFLWFVSMGLFVTGGGLAYTALD